MFKYTWEARFENDGVMVQPDDDRYSKHVDGAEHNKSSFQDLLDYEKISPLRIFTLKSAQGDTFAIDLKSGEFFMNGVTFKLDQPLEELTDRKLIFYRTMRMGMISREQYVYAYNFGYKGNRPGSDKIVKKVVTIS